MYETIWKGSYPKLCTLENDYWSLFYDSYMQTYVERDVRQLTTAGKLLDFVKCMKLHHARTGMMLNYSDFAREVGVSQPTVKSWISIMQLYYNNLNSRIIKTPKIYFMDTGLACYLTGWKTSETLESGAMNGSIFETYVVSEIIKSYWHQGMQADIYYYRDKDGREIDVLIRENGRLYPVEIKKKSTPTKSDTASFHVIADVLRQPCGPGAVICLSNTDIPL